MASLKYIDKQIEELQTEIEHLKNAIRLKSTYLSSFYEHERVKVCQIRLNVLQQIKLELEVVEIIKFGCTGVKYNSDGGSVIKLGNINAMDFIKLSNRLDEICEWSDEDE